MNPQNLDFLRVHLDQNFAEFLNTPATSDSRSFYQIVREISDKINGLLWSPGDRNLTPDEIIRLHKKYEISLAYLTASLW